MTTARFTYRKAGIGYSGVTDDPAGVNAQGILPVGWLKAIVLLANLAVWLDAALRLTA